VQLNSFFTSAHEFDSSQEDLKNKFQMLNIAILLSFISLIYGMVENVLKPSDKIVNFEIFFIFINIGLFLALRYKKEYIKIVSKILTLQYSLLFLYLYYNCEPESLKHIWLFTYPIILLYFEDIKEGIYWLFFMIFMILGSSFIPFLESKYTLFQSFFISFVLIILSTIIYFYQKKMSEARRLIIQQQNELQNLTVEFGLKVEETTSQLRDLNRSLELKVKDKIDELVAKDKLLTVQSKQAVMGEMITMIAHQWRQPLSTITLNISNLHFKMMLGEVTLEEVDKVLLEISDTIVYLSDTIDDFQTFFRPNKAKESIDINLVFQRALNFAKPRMKSLNIEVINEVQKEIIIFTYINELIQVILNLINNAIDHFIEIDKKNPKLRIDIEDMGSSILLFISDNGNGISSENIEHIFEPYFSTKGKNGTGLGLYMSQMIIEKQFHGDIRVKSSEYGTTFIIEISK
jgi:signal transduction histidine kinase